jgi:ribosome biogenesis GTPase
VKELGLLAWGFGPRFEEAFRPLAEEGLVPARVIAGQGRLVRLGTSEGEASGEISGRLRHQAQSGADLPTVGDFVGCEKRPGGSWRVHAVLPRFSAFSRRMAGQDGEEQVLAANVDTVFIVVGLDSNFNTRRVERALVLAWESHARPVVLLTKPDRCEDAEARRREIEASAPAVPVHVLSPKHGTGVEALLPYLISGETLVLLGSSGVGKSTLVNRLLGEDRRKTAEVRETDSRGRHTTTRSALVQLPSGALILDTPGLRELQLWGGAEGLVDVFPEIDQLATECRFRDCRHGTEPGCAVRAAVVAGRLAVERLESLVKLRAEVKAAETPRGIPRRVEEKSRWRPVSKAARSFRPRG